MDNNSHTLVDTPEPENTETIVAEDHVSPDSTPPKNPAEPKKPHNKKKITIIIVVVALILAAGITALIIFLNQPKDNQSTINNTEETSDLAALEKYQLKDNSLSDFDLEFLKMENEEKNKIYSPLSIKYALGILKEGTAGNSYEQIATVIGDYKAKSYLNSSNRSLANVMFVQDNLKDNVKENYITTLQDKFNASVVYDSFASATPINNWVNNKTLGQINNLVDDATVQGKAFALINALAIDMSWKNQIQCTETMSRITPCIHNSLGYSVKYQHENYQTTIRRIYDEQFNSIKFADLDNAKAAEIGADINNYDAVKEIGEEKIRSTIKEEYTAWLQTEEVVDFISHATSDWEKNWIEQDVDKYVNQYLEDLNANYHKTDQATDFYMLDTDAEKVFAKDLQEYDGSTLQYVGIMPKNQTLQDYVKNLTAKKVSSIVNDMKDIKTENFREGVITKITGYIPFFNYDYELNLMDDLKKLGITDVFESDKANLSNMLEDSGSYYITDAIHKANIEFSNDGIKAAAATAAFGAGAGGAPVFIHDWDVPVEIIDLTFDQPYFYIIRDKSTGEVWFSGTVYEPTLND